MKLKNYKRLAAAALAAVMTLSLAACGTPGEPSEGSKDSGKKEASANVERRRLSQRKTGKRCRKSLYLAQRLIICLMEALAYLQNIWQR